MITFIPGLSSGEFRAKNMSVLSQTDRTLIVESWAIVEPDLEKHGAAFFMM